MMYRKPFLSIDDILEQRSEARHFCIEQPRPRKAVKLEREYDIQDIRRQQINNEHRKYLRQCSWNRPSFISCTSPCCHTHGYDGNKGEPASTYSAPRLWHQYYNAYGDHANPFYIRHHFHKPTRKRMRASFSHEQVLALQRVFSSKKYLHNAERTQLARQLNITEQQIKIWFQNKRYKEKKFMINEAKERETLNSDVIIRGSQQTTEHETGIP